MPVRTREIVTKLGCCALNFLGMDLTVAIDQELRLHFEPHSVSIATTSKLARRLVREEKNLIVSFIKPILSSKEFAQEEVAPLHEMTIDFRTTPSDLVARNWNGIILMKCIWPIKAENLIIHPSFQNTLLAHKIKRWLADITGQTERSGGVGP